MATALGVLLGLSPWLGLSVLVTWLVIAYAFRYSSLAAIIASLFAPMYAILMFGTSPVSFAVLVMSVLLLWRHVPNIRKLAQGKESKIGSKKTDAEEGLSGGEAESNGVKPMTAPGSQSELSN